VDDAREPGSSTALTALRSGRDDGTDLGGYAGPLLRL